MNYTNMKERRLSTFRAAFTGLALLAVTAASLAQELTQAAKEEVLKRMTEVVTTSAFVPGKDFSKWPEFLQAQKATIDKAKTPDEFAESVTLTLEKFGISHINLFPPRMAEMRVNPNIVGIGVSLQPEDDGFRVWHVFEKAPAGEAGIEIGDLIIEVNGEKPKTVQPIAGQEGTQVVIKVKKAGGKIKEYHLTRRKFSTRRVETLTYADKAKQTAVIRIWTFDHGYDPANVTRLMEQASTAKNLIVDLRGNGGGAVANMMHFLRMVLPEGTPIGTFVTRSLVNNYVEETNGNPNDLFAIAKWGNKMKVGSSMGTPLFKGKIAVLVDPGSGSASEITAAALKETVGASVVGMKSAGMVLASLMQPMPHGFLLQYPITDYVTVKGLRLEGNGVTPDLEVTMPEMRKINEPDVAVEKAVALLNGASLESLKASSKKKSSSGG
jgi:carboxyl-terminal processing protease